MEVEELYWKWQRTLIKSNQLEVSLQQPIQLLEDTDLKHSLTTYQAENLHQGFLFASTINFSVSPYQTEAWLHVIYEKGLLGDGNTWVRVLSEHECIIKTGGRVLSSLDSATDS